MIAPKTKQRWRPMLLDFIDKLRIVSREESVKPGEGGTKVHLWNSQKRILDELTIGMDAGIRKFNVLKSRQLGSTTIFVIIAIFWHAFHPNTKGAMVFDQDKTRDDFREVLRHIINSVPRSYFGSAFGIKKNGDNKYFMAFTNGSQINFLVAGTSQSKVKWGESSGYSFVLLTEVANYGSPEGLNNFEEAMSENNPDRLYIYEGTGKGRNHWYDRWQEGREDIYSVRCIFVGWWSKELNVIPKDDPRFAQFGLPAPSPSEKELIGEVKERYDFEISREQLAWVRWRGSKKSQSESSLLQNQPWVEEQAFQLSGASFFQTRVIGHDLDRVGSVENPVLYKGYRFWMGRDFWSTKMEHITDSARKGDVQLRIWYEPCENGRYVIGVDPAGGSDDKNDRHAISVWRAFGDKLVQVAEYADNIAETRQCAWVVAYLAGAYRNCVINLELSGGYGNSVMTEFRNLQDLLRAGYNSDKRGNDGESWEDFLSNARWYLYRRPDNPGAVGYVINWKTNGDSKRTILNEFRDSHVNGQIIINSRPLLEEMLAVVQDGSEIGAPGRQKDDRVISACLAHHTWVEEERPGMMAQGLTMDLVMAEDGTSNHGHIVQRIVADYFRRYEEGEMEEESASPDEIWAEERGLK